MTLLKTSPFVFHRRKVSQTGLKQQEDSIIIYSPSCRSISALLSSGEQKRRCLELSHLMKVNGDHSYQAKFPVNNNLNFSKKMASRHLEWNTGVMWSSLFFGPYSLSRSSMTILQNVFILCSTKEKSNRFETRFDHHLLTLMSSV